MVLPNGIKHCTIHATGKTVELMPLLQNELVWPDANSDFQKATPNFIYNHTQVYILLECSAPPKKINWPPGY